MGSVYWTTGNVEVAGHGRSAQTDPPSGSSRVSFFMNKFRKLGFIEYNGKLEVHNSLLNVVLYDKPEIRARATD
jgi:hypothetical protein